MANQRNKDGINKGITWCDYTANIWWGCTKVHEGCDNCYAETLANRWGSNVWGNDNPRRLIKGFFQDLNSYQAAAKKAGEMHRVFVGSMMDIFEKPMPLINSKGEALTETTDYHRQHFFQNISDGIYPNLIFLLLTKRPSNINKYIPEGWKQTPPENVMFGTSPVNQETAYTLINQLLKVKGKRFLSVEPQLGSVNLVHWLPQIDWVIQGGESGHHKRPFDLAWAYDLKEQCQAANVPYFLMIREFPAVEGCSAFC